MTVQERAKVLSAQANRESPPDEYDGHAQTEVDLIRETVPRRTIDSSVQESDTARETVPASPPRPIGSMVRILFGLVWLADVYFKWQPSFLNGLLDVMHDGTMGQPGWLMPWFNFNHAIIAIQPGLWAYGIAIVETAIALALVVGLARKLTYIGGAVWSLLIWATAEGFGRSRPGEIATDIGTAIIYAVVFLALLAADQCSGTRPYSVDALIERRIPWWRGLAEIGR